MAVRIGIAGATGRMGIGLMQCVLATGGAQLSGALVRRNNGYAERDVATLLGIPNTGIAFTENAEKLFAESDVVIDFTRPESTVAFANIAAKHGTRMVIGTTGINTGQEKLLQTCAGQTGLVVSANMSVGVNLLAELVKQVASILDEGADIEIVEMHHRHKVDAPSGTALLLGKAAAAGRETTLERDGVFSRHGHTGERKPGSIGFATLRGGDVVGEHTVIFAAEGERVELTHKASNRDIFAKGAVRAALWVAHQPAGLYSMNDVLGLST